MQQCFKKKPRHIMVFNTVFFNFYNHHFTLKAASLCPSVRKPSSNQRFFFFFFLTITITFLFGWRLGWTETNLNRFDHPPPKTAINYCARKLKLLSPKNRYIGHQRGIWKIYGTFVYCQKGPFYLKSSLSNE